MTTLFDQMTRTPGLPCREDPEPYFSADPVERRYAARQCHGCPLLLACMRYALDADERHGVWGGVDFESRAVGCGTERGYANHKRLRQPVCQLCQTAHDDAVEANRRRILAEAHAAGGTTRGYWMHRRLEEDACVPCRRAVARKSAERRERERAGAERACKGSVGSRAAETLRAAPAGVQALALAG